MEEASGQGKGGSVQEEIRRLWTSVIQVTILAFISNRHGKGKDWSFAARVQRQGTYQAG